LEDSPPFCQYEFSISTDRPPAVVDGIVLTHNSASFIIHQGFPLTLSDP
jgi:hypothetical protein